MRGFGEDIYNGLISLDEAERQQTEIFSKINKLKKYNVRSKKNKKFKKGVIKNLNIPYHARIDIIEGFKNGVFSMSSNTENISEQTDSIMKPKIPGWVHINDFSFNRLKNTIDNAVNKNLGPFLSKEKFNYLPLQDFLQRILDGEFNDAEEARKYSTENIYEKYEKSK